MEATGILTRGVRKPVDAFLIDQHFAGDADVMNHKLQWVNQLGLGNHLDR
jgi:hypothetical protein